MHGDWFWLAYIICAAPPRCTGWCPPLRKKSAPPVLIYIYIYILIYTLCLVVKSHTKNEQHRKHRRKHYRKNTTKKIWELSLTTQKTTHPPPTPKRWRFFLTRGVWSSQTTVLVFAHCTSWWYTIAVQLPASSQTFVEVYQFLCPPFAVFLIFPLVGWVKLPILFLLEPGTWKKFKVQNDT